MGYNKKVGIVLMVTSVVVAIVLFLISDCDCNFSEASLLALVMYGFRIRFFPNETLPYIYSIDIATKYVLFLCLTTFALGLLYYLEVLNAPRKRAPNRAESTPDK